jgi:DNA-binding MarR family transcriptional regulator
MRYNFYMPSPSSPVRIRNHSDPSGIAEVVRDLAWFRYNLRKFLRFSEKAARQCGVTPQQHQLMLGVAGFTGTGSATISQLAEFLQERHNSVVGLIERAVQRGLVDRKQDTTDRRVVLVSLTRQGQDILSRLSQLHYEEMKEAQRSFLKKPKIPSGSFGSGPIESTGKSTRTLNP